MAEIAKPIQWHFPTIVTYRWHGIANAVIEVMDGTIQLVGYTARSVSDHQTLHDGRVLSLHRGAWIPAHEVPRLALCWDAECALGSSHGPARFAPAVPVLAAPARRPERPWGAREGFRA